MQNRVNAKRKARSEADNKARTKAKGQRKITKLYDVYTGKLAPEGALQSEQYIRFITYVRRHVKADKKARIIYVNAITGEPAPGITKETYQHRQHTTRYGWQVSQKYAEFSKILNEGGDLPPVLLRRPKAATADEQDVSLLLALSTMVPPRAGAASVPVEYHFPPQGKVSVEGQRETSKLYDVYTGKPAPEGAPQSKQYIRFAAYVRRHVKTDKMATKTYVNAKTGELAPGITKETHKRGQHTTRYTWLVSQKYAEFSAILKKGGDLPPIFSRSSHQQQNAQTGDEQGVDLFLALSTAAPPIIKSGSLCTLFDSYTGKRAPEGVAKSKQYITFNAYVQRHVEGTTIARTTYVDTIAGEPAPTITKETYHQGQHTTLYKWRLSQKRAEFSAILKKGGDLPPAPLRKTNREKVAATAMRKVDLPPAPSNPVPPTAEALSIAVDPLMTLEHAVVKDKTPSASNSVSVPILLPTSQPVPKAPLDKRQPNLHAFFKAKESDCVGPASKKSKSMSSGDSAVYPLPATATPDSTSEASLSLTPPAKMPTL